MGVTQFIIPFSEGLYFFIYVLGGAYDSFS